MVPIPDQRRLGILVSTTLKTNSSPLPQITPLQSDSFGLAVMFRCTQPFFSFCWFPFVVSPLMIKGSQALSLSGFRVAVLQQHQLRPLGLFSPHPLLGFTLNPFMFSSVPDSISPLPIPIAFRSVSSFLALASNSLLQFFYRHPVVTGLRALPALTFLLLYILVQWASVTSMI
jgi:hypothetical protein